MTETFPEGEFDPTITLVQARNIYARFKDELQRVIDAVSITDAPKEDTKLITAALSNHHKALLQLQTLEADLEKRGDLRNAVRASKLDLQSARTEILARCSRIKERGAD